MLCIVDVENRLFADVFYVFKACYFVFVKLKDDSFHKAFSLFFLCPFSSVFFLFFFSSFFLPSSLLVFLLFAFLSFFLFICLSICSRLQLPSCSLPY